MIRDGFKYFNSLSTRFIKARMQYHYIIILMSIIVFNECGPSVSQICMDIFYEFKQKLFRKPFIAAATNASVGGKAFCFVFLSSKKQNTMYPEHGLSESCTGLSAGETRQWMDTTCKYNDTKLNGS